MTPNAATDVAPLPDSSVTPSEDTLRADKQGQRMNAPDPRLYDEPRLRAALAQLAQGVAALEQNLRPRVSPSTSRVVVTLLPRDADRVRFAASQCCAKSMRS